MTLYDDIKRELPGLQQAAESRMTTTVEIGTPGPWTYDPDLDRDVRTLTDSFTTKARIRVRSSQQESTSERGARTIITTQRELHIPINSPVTAPNMVARVTAIDSLSDPSLAGVEFKILGVLPGDQMTARRLLVEEVQT
jgi:hypothetical protein